MTITARPLRSNAGMTDPLAFSIVCGELDDVTLVVEPHGEIDIATVPEFRAALDSALADGRQCVIVDLGGVSFIGATGLQTLIAAREKLAEKDGVLITVCGDSTIRKVFEITSTVIALQVVKSRGEAVRLAQGLPRAA